MDPLSVMLIDALRADAARHELGKFSEVGCEFDSVEQYRSEHLYLLFDKSASIAHNFWDAWVDQVRHGFGQDFYQGIDSSSWPTLAREIADNLEAGCAITNTLVLRYFDWTKK